jgi:hypothetical protein
VKVEPIGELPPAAMQEGDPIDPIKPIFFSVMAALPSAIFSI